MPTRPTSRWRMRSFFAGLMLAVSALAGAGVLDIDDNGHQDAATDGVLILRYLFGFRGEALTVGAVAPGARRDAAAIAAHLAQIRGQLDVDGNKVSDALTDGILIQRYLSGYSGGRLTAGAAAPGAPHSTPEDLGTRLSDLSAAILLPPDPVDVAPPLDPTVTTTLADATEFLYTGDNPIQTGVAPGTIEDRRAAVIRGKVFDRSINPLPGVTVTVLNHPELGQTLSRADGAFDLVVNGGGVLTLVYEKAGYLPAQRQVQTPWQDYAFAPDVALVTLDPAVTTIDLTAPAGIQVARGSASTDADGTRQATLLFPAEIAAAMVLPDGTTQPLPTLRIRATEYTIGPDGPKAMPAELPPTSAYTYAVEISADEALAAGATSVTLSQPVPFYVENFLGFPVGTSVPVGYYDRKIGQWIAVPDGRVIHLLDINGGVAALDSDGDGSADTAEALAALGITDAEREKLATLYSAGQSLWRVPLNHFTPLDCNWPYGPTPGATPPPVDRARVIGAGKDCRMVNKRRGASTIGCETQALGEAIPVAGTAFNLHYQSERAPGYQGTRTLSVDLTESVLPPDILGVKVAIAVAGRRFESSFAPESNQQMLFQWDGFDAFGRPVEGQADATVTVSYLYAIRYHVGADPYRSFGLPSGVSMPTAIVRVGSGIALDQTEQVILSARVNQAQPIGGWSLDEHHRWDPLRGTLLRGDGNETRANALGAVVVAGNGTPGFSGDGGQATLAMLSAPTGVAVAPDGSLYIADQLNHRIRRVLPNGNIHTVAGGVGGDNQLCGPDENGDWVCVWTEGEEEGVATEATLGTVTGLAVGPDGSLYIADEGINGKDLIRRVGPEGMIATVVGGGGGAIHECRPRLGFWPWGGPAYDETGQCGVFAAGFGGDGGSARWASIYRPRGLAVGPDGSLYIADSGNHRIRRMGPDGIITTVAGADRQCYYVEECIEEGVCFPLDWCEGGDGVSATETSFRAPSDVAVTSDGSLYIASAFEERYGWYEGYVRRVRPDGIVEGSSGCFNCTDIVATDSDIYIGEGSVVGKGGPSYEPGCLTCPPSICSCDLSTFAAGLGVAGFSGDVGPRNLWSSSIVRNIDHEYPGLWSETGSAFAQGPDGNLYIADTSHHRVWRIGRSAGADSAAFVASLDGSEIYAFDTAGRHQRTRDALTGSVLYEFGYDADGRLISVTDGSGNLTAMERNGAGEPTAIVGPHGQRTELILNANGYLASITNPAGETYRMAYTDGGLITRFEGPNGHASAMTYDDLGRLTDDANAVGGSQNLAVEVLEDPPGTEVTVTTAEDVLTAYTAEYLASGEYRGTVTHPGGAKTVTVTSADGTSQTTTALDGTVSVRIEGPDPRFGMSAPVTTSQTVTTPDGLAATVVAASTASLTNPDDLLSLESLTDTATINGRTSTSLYDAATRTTTSTSAAGRVSTTEIDALGHPTLTQTAGLEPIAYTYDARGRLETLTQGIAPDARTVTFAYDADGYLESITDALGRTAGFDYDPAGRVTTQTFPDGRQVLFDYDPKGNLTALTPPGRPEHAFGYTPVDLTAEYVPPDVGAGTNSTQYSYNRDKQLTRVLRPDGEAVDLAYDTAGRLDTLTLPEGDFTYGYHATIGHLSRITAPDGGTLDFSYDGSLLTGAAWAGDIAGSVGFAYDNDFRVSSVSVNGANPVAYIYDPDSLLAQAGGITLARSAQNGLLTGSTLGTVADQWDYNGFGEPDGYTATQSGAPLIAIAYTRDKLGRITEKTETVGGATTTYAYGYDLAGRLVEAKKDGLVQTTWAYDDNGNRTHVNGAVIAHYDDQDRLLDYAGATYAYTANGELQTKTQGASVTRYDYDVLGNLRQVVLPNGTRIDYLTDGRNRRIGKKVNDTLVQGFLYQNQLKLVAELDGAGNVVSRFVYATRVNVPDYMIKGGVSYRILTDHLGSPRLVVGAADGTVVQRMDYDAWGNVLLDTNPGFQPFGFAGGLYDRDTEFVRFGARDYDAGAGRWTANDPVRLGSVEYNRHIYNADDPMNYVDYNGLDRKKDNEDANLGGVLYDSGSIGLSMCVSLADTPADVILEHTKTGRLVRLFPKMRDAANAAAFLEPIPNPFASLLAIPGLAFDAAAIATSEPGLNRSESIAAAICNIAGPCAGPLGYPVQATGLILSTLSAVDPATQARWGRWAAWPALPWLWLLGK